MATPAEPAWSGAGTLRYPLAFLTGVIAMAGAVAPVGAVQAQQVVRRVLELEHPLRHGDYAWDDTDVPAGPLVITADLEAETMSVFRGGYEIGTAAILYGAPSHPTPVGSFRIRQKYERHVSSIYGAPMPYTMRLTDDGVAIHGSSVAWGYASHGCLGVPLPFAKLLFAQARRGDRVIITKGKVLAAGDTIVGRPGTGTAKRALGRKTQQGSGTR